MEAQHVVPDWSSEDPDAAIVVTLRPNWLALQPPSLAAPRQETRRKGELRKCHVLQGECDEREGLIHLLEKASYQPGVKDEDQYK